MDISTMSVVLKKLLYLLLRSYVAPVIIKTKTQKQQRKNSTAPNAVQVHREDEVYDKQHQHKQREKQNEMLLGSNRS